MDAIADLHKTIKIMAETKETDPDEIDLEEENPKPKNCLLYTSPSPRDKRQSRMPSSA